jgi:trans-aconitate 2-methyltransferase
MPWNPDTYHKFQAERFAPFDDLVETIRVREGMRVLDLGCGTGELTSRLAFMLPGSEVLGVDNSTEMLERAQPLAREGLRFEHHTIEEIARDSSQRGAWDLVFTNAALQWVDDHEWLIPAVIALVKPGGQIAVQMPSNHLHYSHLAAIEVASTEPYKSALGGWVRQPPVLGIERYAEMLYASGASPITVFEKIYPHVLEDADAIADWTRGTLCVPYFERVPDDLQHRFDEDYRAKLRARFPGSPLFYGFKRTLFSATMGYIDYRAT